MECQIVQLPGEAVKIVFLPQNDEDRKVLKQMDARKMLAGMSYLGGQLMQGQLLVMPGKNYQK